MLNNNIFDIKLTKNEGRLSVTYTCCKCGKYYTSRNGAKQHHCPNGFTFQNYEIVDIPPTSETVEQEDIFPDTMENLIRFVCTSNIPLRTLDNPFFRKTLYYLNKNFDYLKKEIMAEIIEDFAARISDETFARL